jgi:hypothetical protein
LFTERPNISGNNREFQFKQDHRYQASRIRCPISTLLPTRGDALAEPAVAQESSSISQKNRLPTKALPLDRQP